jgi:hypothetical protein
MSLQQAGAGICSLITFRNAGFFARYRRSPNIFRAFSAACRSLGQVAQRPNTAPIAILGLAWRIAFSGWRRECILTSLPIC